MRIYSNLREAFKETERELFEMGTVVQPDSMQDIITKDKPEFTTKELQGYGYVITSNTNLDKDFLDLGGNLEYADAELEDRIDPDWLNPGSAWEFRSDTWKEFMHNGRFAYTYNERFRDQVSRILVELEEKPNTRQAIITIWDKHQDLGNLGGQARVPCSMYYQLLRRSRQGEEVLDLIYTMRSCDIYTHMIYDIYLAMRFQNYIARKLKLRSGHFTHFIGSLHAYKRDYEQRGIF